MFTMTNALLLAILCVIVILVLSQTIFKSRDEALTNEECALTSQVKLPYNPLIRYDFFRDMDSPNFADITAVGGLSSDLTARHTYLAQKCDETPGCIAFTTTGWLKSGILPEGARKQVTYPSPCEDRAKYCGLFVRKCAKAEPLYADLYSNANFDTGARRYLVPPGDYPNISQITTAITMSGESSAIANDSISSIKIPNGLRVRLYRTFNYGGQELILGPGSYPNLAVYKTGRLAGFEPTFSDSVSSLKVEYA